MITHIRRPCPRCADPIEPGQEMVPMPLGWTHAGCVIPAQNKANVRGGERGEWDNGGPSENGPGPAALTAGSSQGLADYQGVD